MREDKETMGPPLPTEEEYLRTVLEEDGGGGGSPSAPPADGTAGTGPEEHRPGADSAAPEKNRSGPDGAASKRRGLRLPFKGKKRQPAEPNGGPPRSPGGKRTSAAARKRRRRIVRIVILLLVLAVVGYLVYRFFLKKEGGANTEILTDTAHYDSIMSTVEGTGLTRAKNSETITIPYAGTVTEVLVEEGDVVMEGDPLLVIDSDDARQAVTDAQDGVTRALQAVDKAREGITAAQDRVRDAQESVTTARDRVRDAQDGVTTAQDSVAAAQKRVDTAQKALNDVVKKREDLQVRAAYTGALLETAKLSPGDRVSEGTVIATLADDTRLKLVQYFSYAYVDDLRPGLPVSVSVPKLMSEAPGTVEEIHLVSRVTEEGSRLFSAEISVENPGGLADGMEATAYTEIDGEMVYPYEAGKLEYYRSTEVKTEVGGKVIASYLLDYMRVSPGEVLLELDGEDLEEKIDDARKDVEDAEKGVEDALRGVESARDRVREAEKGVEDAQKNVTETQKGVTDAENEVEEKRKDVTEAEEKLEKAREELEKCNAVAPISGKVIGLDAFVGEQIPAGKVAMAISDTSTIVVNATVDERNISYVKKGMTVELDQWGVPAMGVIDSVSLSSSLNNGVATYPMVISVDNYDESLQVNSNIRYSLVASQSDNCLVVPIQCVRSVSTESGESMTVVYVEGEPENAVEGVYADEEIPDGFQPVEVEIGIQDTYNVEIRSGLNEGDVVFTQMQSMDPW